MRNPEYQFVPVDTSELLEQMIADYEAASGRSLVPASPESLMLHWVASLLLGDRVKSNYSANQNLPSRADGENLDALAELFFTQKRPEATNAACTMRFTISEAQSSAVLVPKGTRVTDGAQTLYWETESDAWIAAGDTYVETGVRCQTAGAVGNNWEVGSINTIVDVFDYYTSCENVTASDGGSDRLSDEAFYELLRVSLDSFSTAGARGSYIYHAKNTSGEIADVVVNSPVAGEVYIYVLDSDGQVWSDGSVTKRFPGKAGAALKALVLAACNDETVRPLTDKVVMADPGEVSYDIELTYYISSQSEQTATVASEVAAKVDEYIRWQQGKLGRDINPSKLISMLMSIPSIKRVAITYPTYTVLQDGAVDDSGEIILADTVPEIGKVGTITLTNGGVENE